MNTEQINLLISLKNAARAGRESITVSFSYSRLLLISLLYQEGFILFYCVENNSVLIYLRFFCGVSSLKDLKVLYKKDYVKSLSYRNISNIRYSKHLLFFSTDNGHLNLTSLKIKHLGGKILFIC